MPPHDAPHPPGSLRLERMAASTRIGEGAPGPGRPREERVTVAVLEAVVALVTETGLDAVTMDAVAARAGVSKPAIYRRWPTKQDLVIAQVLIAREARR